jgi:hypothetical protein
MAVGAMGFRAPTPPPGGADDLGESVGWEAVNDRAQKILDDAPALSGRDAVRPPTRP